MEWAAIAAHVRGGAPVFEGSGWRPDARRERPSVQEGASERCPQLQAAVRNPCTTGGEATNEQGDLPIRVYQQLMEIGMDGQQGAKRPIKIDGRAQARKNEVSVLRALHRFGWLRTRELAVLGWKIWAVKPEGIPSLGPPQPTSSAVRMAQRTLRRLKQQRQVLSATAPDGSQIYALAEAGARVLQEIGVPAASGKDLMRAFSAAHYRHRSIANQVAVGAILAGFRVSTEREISRGLWPGGEVGIAGKKPDVLVRSATHWHWVEVERSKKNAKDYEMLLRWLGYLRKSVWLPAAPVADGALLAKVVFICRGSFKTRLERDLIRLGWKKDEIYAFMGFETNLYKMEGILFF